MNLNIANEKQLKVLDSKTLVAIADLALKVAGQPISGIAATLHFVEGKEIARLNKEYRNINKPTDVLSFRSLGVWKDKKINKKNYYIDYDPATKSIEIGDIFICTDVAKAQAKEYKHSFDREIAELFVHGILHLIGHDHHQETEAEEMRALEEKINLKLGKIIHEGGGNGI